MGSIVYLTVTVCVHDFSKTNEWIFMNSFCMGRSWPKEEVVVRKMRIRIKNLPVLVIPHQQYRLMLVGAL